MNISVEGLQEENERLKSDFSMVLRDLRNYIHKDALMGVVVEMLEELEEAGRPHTGRPIQYPDGCECEQCEKWDSGMRLLTQLRELTKEEKHG